METGEKTQKKGIWDEKLYLERARAALPLLVRQAGAEQTIYYSDLAAELGMPNPRNLNFVLGAIGNELKRLGRIHGKSIPPIQTLVVNKKTKLPGEGILWFLRDRKKIRERYSKANNRLRQHILRDLLFDVFNYEYWPEVLNALKLRPTKEIALKLASSPRGRFGSEEGPAHKALKKLIQSKPHLLGIRNTLKREVEYSLQSGDKIDVFFETQNEIYAVEVKPADAPIYDINRGIFQTVKYQAVIEAQQRLLAKSKQKDVFSLLVLGGEFPEELRSTKNTLGVQVFAGMMPNGS